MRGSDALCVCVCVCSVCAYVCVLSQTLEEISALVRDITMQLRDKKALLQPQIKALKVGACGFHVCVITTCVWIFYCV